MNDMVKKLFLQLIISSITSTKKNGTDNLEFKFIKFLDMICNDNPGLEPAYFILFSYDNIFNRLYLSLEKIEFSLAGICKNLFLFDFKMDSRSVNEASFDNKLFDAEDGNDMYKSFSISFSEAYWLAICDNGFNGSLESPVWFVFVSWGSADGWELKKLDTTSIINQDARNELSVCVLVTFTFVNGIPTKTVDITERVLFF